MRGAAEVDVVVVGGGVVGLAAAAALARDGRSVWLLERRDGLLREASSRNSGVIHAGLYYPPGSLKAESCVEGRQRLYAHCERLGLPHRRSGKWVVAVEAGEVAALEAMQRRGRACGVEGLEIVDGASFARAVPGARAVAALHSRDSGLVDPHAFGLSLAAEAEATGALIALRQEVCGIEPVAGGYRVETRSGDECATVRCAALVNAAGLAADRVAALAGLDVEAQGYRLHPCKGDYFSLAPGAPLRIEVPIYPAPGAGPGLGIHATPDLAGRVRLGPDAHYVDDPGDLAVDPARAGAFAAAAQRYLPALREAWLAPDEAGLRARLAAPGEAFRDFVVCEESEAGRPGFVDCIGIESPGLTAALALGARVRSLLAAL